MINLDAQYSGGQLGRALIQEPEELAYALQEFADGEQEKTIDEVAEYFAGNADQTANFLRRLADKIETAYNLK